MTEYTIGELQELLGQAARQRGWKKMLCGRAVLEAVRSNTLTAEPRQPWEPRPELLTAVDLVLCEDMPENQFQLTFHSTPGSCQVKGTRVDHSACPVTEGVLIP